jgi:RNA polymerase sigma-70 factor (ECF subfamily)
MADERTLIHRARQGETRAAEELFRRHWRTAWRAAYAVTMRRELANDVAQEGFVRAVSSLDRFDVTRPFAPWLTRICANLAIDELRRERHLSSGEQPDTAAEPPPEADDAVVRAVARLAPERSA